MNNRITDLRHGDFWEEYRQLSDQKFELILTDPPYGVLKRAGHPWDLAIDWNRSEGILYNLLKPNGQLITFADWNLMWRLQAAFSHKLEFKHFYVWSKPGGMPVNEFNPLKDSEFILVFKRKEDKVPDLTFNPYESGIIGNPYQKQNYDQEMSVRGGQKKPVDINDDGKRWIRSVLEAPAKPNMRKEERTNHPTQKPLDLLRTLIRVHSLVGDSILDPFAGSGSTLVAAYLEDRKSVGFEIEEEYFVEAKERIIRISSQTTLELKDVS